MGGITGGVVGVQWRIQLGGGGGFGGLSSPQLDYMMFVHIF